MVECGIVGLPNSGKSTLFNALLQRQIANVADYPFTTIEPNFGVVEVPDERLAKISQATGIKKVVPAAIKFVDIAGLVRGAHQGEGLGNQFLGHIREVDAILQVVRAFQNPNVSHVHGKIDPKEDIEVVNLELELGGIKKPTIYVLNVSESDLAKNYDLTYPYIKISAKLEAELADLSVREQKEYLKELGIAKSGLDQVIQESYQLLDLITFFTVAHEKQVQAWSLKAGSTIIEAAEMIHSDFARGFVKAEVVNWQKLVEAGAFQVAREKGLVRFEGKDYLVADGDIILVKFNI